jgi:predicted amidohydrolase
MTDVDLFAVQPRVELADYLDEDAFAARHQRLAERIASMRSAEHALAVWPEEVATFLVLLGQRRVVEGCSTTEQALRRIVLRRAPRLLATMARHRTLDVTPAVLTMLAPRALAAYEQVFSGIARDHGLWVVAGSGLFPRPGTAQVCNTSHTYAPSGARVGVTRKVNLVPTQEDVLGLSAGRVDELEVVRTPFGGLGTVICYDGFAEAHTSGEPGWTACAPVLDRLGARVLAQPSANAWPWDAPWAFNEPGEQLLRSEQWMAEGLARQMRDLAHVRYAVNPQVVGRVLEHVFEAPSLILGPGGTVLARAADPRAEEVLHVRVSLPESEAPAGGGRVRRTPPRSAPGATAG